MTTIAEQLEQNEANRRKLLAHQNKVRANKTFVCLCGHRHQIKECAVIQTHWYTPPRGCMEGDHWNQGELQIVCFDTEKKNRVLFEIRNTPWEKRHHYDYSPDMQFSRMYRHLFKEVIQDYKEDNRAWVNNYYFDEHRAKFELCSKVIQEKE